MKVLHQNFSYSQEYGQGLLTDVNPEKASPEPVWAYKSQTHLFT